MCKYKSYMGPCGHTDRHGRGLRGTGGTVPPNKFEVGDGPCIRPPIFREVVLSDACESTN